MAKRKAEATRKKILTAAEKLFAEKGFDATSVESIAQASGVNKALIYYYFKDKNDLILCLFKNTYQDLCDRIRPAAIDPDQGDRAVARAQLKREISCLTDKKRILSLLLMEELKNNGRDGRLFDYADLIMGRDQEETPGSGAGNGNGDEDKVDQGKVLEFFSGLMPLLAFVTLGDKWAEHFGCSSEALADQFVAAFDQSYLSLDRT